MIKTKQNIELKIEILKYLKILSMDWIYKKLKGFKFYQCNCEIYKNCWYDTLSKVWAPSITDRKLLKRYTYQTIATSI